MSQSDINKNFPEVETTTEDLMYGSSAEDLKLRIISSVSGSSILGIIEEETQDSFLVYLPSKLMAYKDKRTIEPYVGARFIRVIKATVLTVAPCFGDFEFFFIEYIITEGAKICPDYVTGVYLKRLQKRFIGLKERYKEEREELQQQEDNIDTSDKVVLSPGVTKYKH